MSLGVDTVCPLCVTLKKYLYLRYYTPYSKMLTVKNNYHCQREREKFTVLNCITQQCATDRRKQSIKKAIHVS